MITMTTEQMAAALKLGTAWMEDPAQEWWMPIWSHMGGWVWNSGPEQRYELVLT